MTHLDSSPSTLADKLELIEGIVIILVVTPFIIWDMFRQPRKYPREM